MSEETSAPSCKGSQAVEDHAMVELGRCAHRIGGATYTYLEFACPDCGATSRRGPVVFACGTGQPAVRPTAENCLAMKWKADRTPAPAA